MNANLTASATRIEVADILRGFAVVGILLIHSIEHFNFLIYPEYSGPVLAFFDQAIFKSISFLFGGKAYAIFALLFGFSFFIQDNNRLQKGGDFRGRFLWRLVLLLLLGQLNAAFYTGDVLVLFAVVGWVLPLTARMCDKAVFWIAVVLMLQPLEWIKMGIGIFHPSYEPIEYLFVKHYQQTLPVLADGNFFETARMSLTSGQAYSFLWAVEHGRLFQTAALFLFGMLVGRRNLFRDEGGNVAFWTRTAITGIACFLPLSGLHSLLGEGIYNTAVSTPLGLIVKTLSSFAFMCFLVAVIVLAYYRTSASGVLSWLAPYGRMSLTMYITQSMLGGFIFYGWGLSLADKLSATQSLLAAAAIFAIQYTFAILWLRSHRQGPLEWIWKKATWIGAGKEMK